MSSALTSLRRETRLAIAVMFVVGGGATAWCALTPLAGAVVASGTVVVESEVKKIQHPTGGVVKRLLVSEGQAVKAGDLLVQLDDTAARTSLGIVTADLLSSRAKLARLAAERDGRDDVVFPADLVDAASTDPNVRLVLDSERRVLSTRLATRDGQKAQLRQRIEQLGTECDGLAAQQDALARQRTLAASDLGNLKGLIAKNLVTRARVGDLEREVIKLDGEIGSVVAQHAEAQSKQSETAMQILGLDQDAATEVAKDMRETEGKIEELIEKQVAAQDQLVRSDIKAPDEGVVHDLAIHTVGGVVAPGEVLMVVVPQSEPLVVEAKVRPTDIDQVRFGQETRLSLTAFNHRTTPELEGMVFRVPADQTLDPHTGAAFYTVGIRVSRAELDRILPQHLLPGMPVEAYLKTSERTVGGYLLKPLADQMNHALRED